MTNRERLISLLGFSPDSNSLEGEMLDADIDSLDEYEPIMATPIKKCAIKIMEILLTTADTSNNTGFNIHYDRAAVEKRILLFKNELGLVDLTMPTINSKVYW